MASRAVSLQLDRAKNAADSTSKSSILQTQADERSILLNQYFASTKVLQVIQDFMTVLADSYKVHLRLPANPYPELLETIRMHELRQALALQEERGTSTALELTIHRDQSPSIPPRLRVYIVEHEQFAMPIWGVKSTLEQLTVTHLCGLLKHLNSGLQGLLSFKEFADDECKVSAYGVLVGNSIFGSSLQDLPPCSLELETHVFVVGAYLEKTMAVFARFLLKQLHEAISAATTFVSLSPEDAANYCGCVACDGICITTLSSGSISSSDSSVWTMDRAVDNRIAYSNAIKTALVSSSMIALRRYQCAKLHGSGDIVMNRLDQTFFFHFILDNGSKTVANKHSPSRRSFIAGSNAVTSGIFFDAQGAREVVLHFWMEIQDEEERKKQLQKKTQATQVIHHGVEANSDIESRPGFAGILHETVESLHRLNLSIDAFRQQMSCLVEYFAFSLGLLIGAHQVVEELLCHHKICAAMTAIIQASFSGLQAHMERFLAEARSSPVTSMLHPVIDLLEQFHQDVKSTSTMLDEEQIGECVEALRCLDKLALIVIRMTFDDFLRLARVTATPTKAANQPPENRLKQNRTPPDEIDVVRAFQIAVEERKYPTTILSEVVFAQAVVDSCLDVALESAVMNTVAFCLPPNPFIDLSIHLQVFALRQLVWKDELHLTSPIGITQIVDPGSLPLVSLQDNTLCAVNPGLLSLISSEQVVSTHRWLKNHGILHQGTFRPSNSLYSAAILPMVLIFSPSMFVGKSPKHIEMLPLLKETDLMEHYIFEGKEHGQARSFFAEAVRTDLRRITAMRGAWPADEGNTCWQLEAEANIRDPHDQIVTFLDLSPSTSNESLDKIINEAVQMQCMVQIVIQVAEMKTCGDSSTLTIHNVSKAYAFHHRSVADAGSSSRLSPLACFRVSRYGIFVSKESALLCLQRIQESIEPSRSGDVSIPRHEWTPYASQALQRSDMFLIYELDIHWQNNDSQLTGRLTKHSDILQLYTLEKAVVWLLDSLQTRAWQLHVTPSRSRQQDPVPQLLPSVIFSIQHRLALLIANQMERVVVPLNHHLHFLHDISDYVTTLKDRIARWQIIQPLTEEQLELQRQRQQKPPEHILLTPRENPTTVTNELRATLHTTWILVLFFRFSYQRAFFVNAQHKSNQGNER